MRCCVSLGREAALLAMNHPVTTVGIAAGAIVALYVGSYFLAVSQVRVGITRGSHVSVIPWYRQGPSWPGAQFFYRPIHLLDREYLRRSVWRDRRAREGERWYRTSRRRVIKAAVTKDYT